MDHAQYSLEARPLLVYASKGLLSALNLKRMNEETGLTTGTRQLETPGRLRVITTRK